MPTAPFLAVGDSGEIAGQRFDVGGRLQLDHGRGPWDEWYVALDDRRWAWLAQAQGHVYLTFPVAADDAPDWDELEPGARFTLSAAPDITFTVTERSGSALLSAEGELPFAAVPMSSGRYVDAESPNDGFATVDFGDGSEPPQVFVGKRYPRSALSLTREGLGPRPVEKVETKRLRCPTCGAPVPISQPADTETVACSSCNALLDYTQGDLVLLQRQANPEYRQVIPLGAHGTLLDEAVTVIGFMVRYVEEDGVRYRWGEYLLHSADGYRYLVETQGHFLYTRPISIADVVDTNATARYQDKRARVFQQGTAIVEYVVGEFYYKVMVADEARTRDYVAPPYMLSRENTAGETHWSLGQYLSADEVFAGLQLSERPPQMLGVAPAQPNPHRIWSGFKMAFALIGLLLLTHFGLSCGQDQKQLANMVLSVPPTPHPTPTPPEYTKLSDPFTIKRGPTTLALKLESDVANSWVGVACALVNDGNGEVRQFYVSAERWEGGFGEDAYNEGSPITTTYLGKVKAGTYTMRFLPEWGMGPGSSGRPPQAAISVRSGQRSSALLWICLFLLLVPAFLRIWRSIAFEGRRWRESNTR